MYKLWKDDAELSPPFSSRVASINFEASKLYQNGIKKGTWNVERVRDKNCENA